MSTNCVNITYYLATVCCCRSDVWLGADVSGGDIPACERGRLPRRPLLYRGLGGSAGGDFLSSTEQPTS